LGGGWMLIPLAAFVSGVFCAFCVWSFLPLCSYIGCLGVFNTLRIGSKSHRKMRFFYLYR